MRCCRHRSAFCLAAVLPLLLLAGPGWAAEPPALFYDPAVPPAAFAASEIRRAQAMAGEGLREHAIGEIGAIATKRKWVIAAGSQPCREAAGSLGIAPPEAKGAQAYSIRRAGPSVLVCGADPAGAMYGGLDLAEAIRLGTLEQLPDSDNAPHIERRGIKFNIPLDARTPSYSDNSDAAQNNIAEMWSMDFWRTFLDEMARHRYNVLTLWSLHPFPSLVKVPEFPQVALNDVKRTTVPMDDTFSHTGSDMVRPVMLEHLVTVKKMSIDEKIRFWRDVMQLAHDRGIEVYLFTWNIFTFGAEGHYGITSAQDNQTTIDYFRASVRETILTYPLLAGIGVTAGEHMQPRRDQFSKEKWLWKTYGEGIRDARKLLPNRHVRLIHRYHQTSQSEIFEEWKDYPDTFELSFKYAIAHMYSIPNPPFIRDVLDHLPPGRKTWLTVRNDDIYSFRWGDPEYARAFIRHMPPKEKMAGFYMGPDGYTWGREFLAAEPDTPREAVISKQWYSFLLWGRLSYNPNLPDELFRTIVARRFPQTDGGKLFQAWAHASKIFPRITSFFWGDIDLRWFPEACLSHPRHRGFYTVRDFVEGSTMPGSGILNIVQWRKRKLSGQPMNGTTPLDVAADLQQHATAALGLVSELRSRPIPDKELRLTLGDLEAMAHLGNYYAAKIRAATELALFDRTSEDARRRAAIQLLQTALDHWKRYARAYSHQYQQPKLYNRVGWVDIPELTGKVEQDIAIARFWAPGTIPDAAPKPPSDRPFRK